MLLEQNKYLTYELINGILLNLFLRLKRILLVCTKRKSLIWVSKKTKTTTKKNLYD